MFSGQQLLLAHDQALYIHYPPALPLHLIDYFAANPRHHTIQLYVTLKNKDSKKMIAMMLLYCLIFKS